MSSVPEEGRNNTIKHGFCNENFRPSCPSCPSRPSFRPGLPVRLTADEDRKRKHEEYEALLAVNECQLPDPLASPNKMVSNGLKSPWLNEKVGMRKWPPISQIQIAEFLLTADQSIGLGKQLLSDYKEGKAYSYFACGWLKDIYFNEISPNNNNCFLKSESTPSQGINNIPHKIWVEVQKKSGTAMSAYCTCFAR